MTQAIVFLLAALVCVPLAVRLGLGAVLGYLLAGVAIGPVGLALVSDPAAILHVSELGVVLMLFLIGLELEPQRLWAMRRAVLLGGALQMGLCAALLMPVGLLLGWGWRASLVGGLAMALSSTAIAVAILQERNLMARPVGQSGFSMLLFQDMAAIPLLALAAVLGTAGAESAPAIATHASHTTSQPTASRPLLESSSPRLSSARNSTTVLATDKASPSTKPAPIGQPQHQATPMPIKVATPICTTAPGTATLRTASKSAKEKCSPTPNISNITPISANWPASATSATKPGVPGPIITPASK
jgi:hypothetical protein